MAIAPLSADTPRCRLIRAAGTELNVLSCGRGRRTVVLLHGFGDTHATWRNVVPALSGRHRVVSLDLPGFGASATLPGPLLDGQVAAIEGVLDALGVTGQVSLVGNSMGGAAALRFALAHPDRTDRVVTIAPAGLGVGVPIWWRAVSGQLLSLRLVLLALEVVPPALVESVARQIFLRLVGPRRPRPCPRRRRRRRAPGDHRRPRPLPPDRAPRRAAGAPRPLPAVLTRRLADPRRSRAVYSPPRRSRSARV